jgi:hypothetical protein
MSAPVSRRPLATVDGGSPPDPSDHSVLHGVLLLAHCRTFPTKEAKFIEKMQSNLAEINQDMDQLAAKIEKSFAAET